MDEVLTTAVQANVFCLILIVLAVFLFSESSERVFNVIAAFWAGFCFSVFGWAVYVAAHFIRKYW